MRNKLVLLAAVLCLVLAAPLAWAGERLDKIMKDKVLRVGTPGDYRPFAMLENGAYAGFDVDLIQMMARDLGVEVQFVATTWPKLMDDFKADKYDVALGGVTRSVARVAQSEFLPGYAPFGKVALIRAADKGKFTTPESLNQPEVRVIKNPGGTNEKYVLDNLTKATVSTHEKNAEIPGLIAEGKGDVMITETYEALLYAQKDPRLFAAFVDNPLTPANTLGFMIQSDDPDFVRMMDFLWVTRELRGEMTANQAKWLK
ncbi:MAG: transporter substrate-binding domain-containing protein [Candidatus Adiutrix sp.]|nr:transporter substrate-binding domain-containing protein [Candidatus Adiutrix sp.]